MDSLLLHKPIFTFTALKMINIQAINIQIHLLQFTMTIKKKRGFHQLIILDLLSSRRRILGRLRLV